MACVTRNENIVTSDEYAVAQTVVDNQRSNVHHDQHYLLGGDPRRLERGYSNSGRSWANEVWIGWKLTGSASDFRDNSVEKSSPLQGQHP